MVNVPVTVVTEWTGPAGFIINNTAQSIMSSIINYTSTIAVDSFGRDESGIYTCEATATTTSTFLKDSASHNGTFRITVGEATIIDNHMQYYFCMYYTEVPYDIYIA